MSLIFGPTYAEQLDPSRMDPAIRAQALEARTADPLDPINLFNITWKNEENKVHHVILPPELVGISTPIVVIFGRPFPTGSHKVGATYSVAKEHQLDGDILPGEHRLVWPSTGNYGIGGAWVGPRMGYESLVVLPEEMSRERFDRIREYGASVIKTPGCESNVKEIYDKVRELRGDTRNRILNQFEAFGNYRFHYHVTGNSIHHLLEDLTASGELTARPAAFVSAMGSAGTIAAGDRLKQLYGGLAIVGVEPTQCPTLFNNGYGGHDIQGIGDKHVTWIHNVLNMDLLVCIDDMACKRGLRLLSEQVGREVLSSLGVSSELVDKLASVFGISGVCNVLAAIKTCHYYDLGAHDVVVTVATDSIDRYHSVMADLKEAEGPLDRDRAFRIMESFQRPTLDWILEGTRHERQRWHNLKYYTWVEQQGRTVKDLDRQRSREFWSKEQALVETYDQQLLDWRAAQ